MNIIEYIGRKIDGLPTHDSKDLIHAKMHQTIISRNINYKYDLSCKKTDNFMFGAISPVIDTDDLIDSNDLEKKAAEIYRFYNDKWTIKTLYIV